ncbi:chromate transporter [Hydrogenophaga sp. 5NK40-0174]|uniref:chromate transporter n=1 Tax=Hydrogenophaga sp. 5NK40-0174 TaxID=3127649 RepID=UPI003106E19D
MSSTDQDTPLDGAARRPHSRTELFVAFTILALQGFGGVLAVVQRELVEKRQWLTSAQFVEDWAVAQILPGPNVVNLSMMIGGRYYGLSGALSALCGMLLAPTLVALVMAAFYDSFSDLEAVQGALRGMSAVAAGMIIATGLKLIAALRTNPMGIATCVALAAASFLAIGVIRWPLLAVLPVLGILGWAIAFERLKPSEGSRS